MASRTTTHVVIAAALVGAVAYFAPEVVDEVGDFLGDAVGANDAVTLGEGEAALLVAANAKLVGCDPGTIVAERSCDGLRILVVDASRMPFIARNTKLAWESGHPAMLTMDRTKMSANRGAACPKSFLKPPGSGSSWSSRIRISSRPVLRGRGHRQGTGPVLGAVNVPTDLIDKYRWVNDIEAWTVSVIDGRGWEDVVRLHGGDPAAPVGDLTFAGVDEQRGPQPDNLEFYVQVLVPGDVVVTIEHNGWSGSLPEIARRCSVGGGRFFSVYWNVNAIGLVTQAVDGAIAARFEALYPLDPEDGQGERRPGWAIGPPVDVGLAWQVDMALLEQQTGVVVDPEWLRMPLPTYRTTDPHWLYRDVDGADRI